MRTYAISNPVTQSTIDKEVRARLDSASLTVNRGSLLSLSTSNGKLTLTSQAIRKIGLAKFSNMARFNLRGANIAVFNTPAGGYTFEGKRHLVCPGAGGCLDVCFAMQNRYKFANVQIPRVVNHQSLLKLRELGETSVFLALHSMVQRHKKAHPSCGIIRLHDSGDFFSKWYTEAWLRVFRQHRDILFYCYTKSFPLMPAPWNRPANLRLVHSFGGKFDNEIDVNQPHSRIFKDRQELERAGYVDANSKTLGEIATIQGKIKLGLAYHGARKPTAAQLEVLREATP